MLSLLVLSNTQLSRRAAARRSNGSDSVLLRSYVESNIILDFVGQMIDVGPTRYAVMGYGFEGGGVYLNVWSDTLSLCR